MPLTDADVGLATGGLSDADVGLAPSGVQKTKRTPLPPPDLQNPFIPQALGDIGDAAAYQWGLAKRAIAAPLYGAQRLATGIADLPTEIANRVRMARAANNLEALFWPQRTTYYAPGTTAPYSEGPDIKVLPEIKVDPTKVIPGHYEMPKTVGAVDPMSFLTAPMQEGKWVPEGTEELTPLGGAYNALAATLNQFVNRQNALVLPFGGTRAAMTMFGAPMTAEYPETVQRAQQVIASPEATPGEKGGAFMEIPLNTLLLGGVGGLLRPREAGPTGIRPETIPSGEIRAGTSEMPWTPPPPGPIRAGTPQMPWAMPDRPITILPTIEKPTGAGLGGEPIREVTKGVRLKSAQEVTETGRRSLYSGMDPQDLARRIVPAVRWGGRLLMGRQGDTHADILQRNGVDPETVPHPDPARGFADPETGQFLSRREAEKMTGIIGKADAGGLDSMDLPGAAQAAVMRQAGMGEQEIANELSKPPVNKKVAKEGTTVEVFSELRKAGVNKDALEKAALAYDEQQGVEKGYRVGEREGMTPGGEGIWNRQDAISYEYFARALLNGDPNSVSLYQQALKGPQNAIRELRPDRVSETQPSERVPQVGEEIRGRAEAEGVAQEKETPKVEGGRLYSGIDPSETPQKLKDLFRSVGGSLTINVKDPRNQQRAAELVARNDIPSFGTKSYFEAMAKGEGHGAIEAKHFGEANRLGFRFLETKHYKLPTSLRSPEIQKAVTGAVNRIRDEHGPVAERALLESLLNTDTWGHTSILLGVDDALDSGAKVSRDGNMVVFDFPNELAAERWFERNEGGYSEGEISERQGTRVLASVKSTLEIGGYDVEPFLLGETFKGVHPDIDKLVDETTKTGRYQEAEGFYTSDKGKLFDDLTKVSQELRGLGWRSEKWSPDEAFRESRTRGELYSGIDLSRLIPGKRETVRHKMKIGFVSGAPTWLKKADVVRDAEFEGNIGGPSQYRDITRFREGRDTGGNWYYHHPDQPGVVMSKSTHKPYLQLIDPKIKSEKFTVDGRPATAAQVAEIKKYQQDERIRDVVTLDLEKVEKEGAVKPSPLRTELSKGQTFGEKLYSGIPIFDPELWGGTKQAQDAAKKFAEWTAKKTSASVPEKEVPVKLHESLDDSVKGTFSLTQNLAARILGKDTNSRARQLFNFYANKWAGYSAPHHVTVSENLANRLVRVTASRVIAETEAGYSGLNEATLRDQIWKSSQKDLYNAYIEEGAAIPVTKGTPTAPTIKGQETVKVTVGGKAVWLRKDLVSEMERGLGRGGEWEKGAVGMLTDVATELQVVGPTDIFYHTANMMASILMDLARGGSKLGDLPGGVPGLQHLEMLTRFAYGTYRGMIEKPETHAELMRLAKIGALRSTRSSQGMLAKIPVVGKFFDWGRLIRILDRGGRLVRSEMFDQLVERKWANDTPFERREFVDKMGKYQDLLMPKYQSFMKRYFSQFVVAGRTFNRNAFQVVMMQNPVRAANPAAYWKMKLLNVHSVAATLFTTTIALNYYYTKTFFGREGVPLGQIDSGENDPKTGQPITFDPLQTNLMRRGLRITGGQALYRGLKKGKSFGDILIDMGKDVANGLLHPWFGPPLRVAYTAMTGKEIGFGGREISEDPGSIKENLKAALTQVNPSVAAWVEGKKEGKSGPLSAVQRLGGAIGFKRGEYPTHQQILEKETGKKLETMGYGERLEAERAHKKTEAPLPEATKAKGAAQAVLNISHRGKEIAGRMSKADRQWIESRGLSVPGYDNKLERGRVAVHLTKDEEKRLSDIILEEYNTEIASMRKDADIDEMEDKGVYFNRRMTYARQRARGRLIDELDAKSSPKNESNKRKRFSAFDFTK